MTPQEQQLLQGLVQRVQSTQLAGKDGEAEQLIQGSLGRSPDSLYILCQTVLVQQYALEQAQKQLADARTQIETLQQQTAQGEHHTSFLGKLFGGGGNDYEPVRPVQPNQAAYAPVRSAGAPPQPGYGPAPGYGPPQGYAPPPGYGQPQYMPAPAGGLFGGGGFGGGGFLQGAMQTAAGVAAGELAFRGIEDLMHGFGHEAGYGSDRALGGFDGGSSFSGGDGGRDGGDSFGDRLQAADGSGNELSPDIEDRRGDGGGRGFFGGDGGDVGSGGGDALDDTGGDNAGFDDTGADDPGGSDTGGDFGGDDGGGFDSGGGDDNSF